MRPGSALCQNETTIHGRTLWRRTIFGWRDYQSSALKSSPEQPRETLAGKRFNVAYIWSRQNGLNWAHQKTYLPNDDGYWEANWYDRAPVEFQTFCVHGLVIGFMICTEIWFLQHAREYAKLGVHILLNPRSTPRHTNAKWLAGGQTAAVVSGAFCLSSNHAGQVDQLELGGTGWLCDPDGVVLATTSDEQPFVTIDLDPGVADAAKSTYPRYVDDSAH